MLTVAHGLFNDYSLTWAPQAMWFFQKNGDEYSTPPQVPRGWYVLSGYASQRSNDVQNSAAPGSSTLESQQLDAAAVYFVESEYDPNLPGRGGYGGYLSSDAGPFNEHFLSESNKILAGYPFDPISPANWGKMHATAPANLSFRPLNPKVFVTQSLQSFSGNSGGPLYLQQPDGLFYPAGIYLGGSGQSRVRVIDSQVVDLINRAEASGNDGGNHTGGGVIRIDRGTFGANNWHLIVSNATSPGAVVVEFNPSAGLRRLRPGRVRKLFTRESNVDQVRIASCTSPSGNSPAVPLLLPPSSNPFTHSPGSKLRALEKPRTAPRSNSSPSATPKA